MSAASIPTPRSAVILLSAEVPPGRGPNRSPAASSPALSGDDQTYIPLSRRTSEELLANAAELRRMATTANTMDVMHALLTLADRYTALAGRRRVAKGC